MIPLDVQEQVREHFEAELKGTVKLDHFTQRPSSVFVPGREDCALCPQALQMIEELARLSDRIDLRVHDLGADRALEERYGVEAVPATVVRGALNRPLLYLGTPLGQLFGALLDAIVRVSGPAPEPPPLVKRRLKRLRRAVPVTVFTHPEDPNSTMQCAIVQLIALSSQHIRAEIVEVMEFPRRAEAHAIQAVPTTVIDGKVVLPGVIEAETLVDEIVRASEHQTVIARTGLITGAAVKDAMPIPQARPAENVTTRPSGLIIPGR